MGGICSGSCGRGVTKCLRADGAEARGKKVTWSNKAGVLFTHSTSSKVSEVYYSMAGSTDSSSADSQADYKTVASQTTVIHHDQQSSAVTTIFHDRQSGAVSFCCPTVVFAKRDEAYSQVLFTRAQSFLNKIQGSFLPNEVLPGATGACYLLPNNSGRSPNEFYDIEKEPFSKGGFGLVRVAHSKLRADESYVMKSIVKARIPKMAMFRNEILFHSEMDSPYIVRLLETFEDQLSVHIVMESCEGGELLHHIWEGPAEETVAWALGKQVLSALNYMHGRGLAHRDIKPENLLIKEKGVPLIQCTLKVIDFGLAQRFGNGWTMKNKVGTPMYMAPEIIGAPEHSEKVDIWSCGTVLYILFCCYAPFEHEDAEQLQLRKLQGQLDFDGLEWTSVSPCAKQLIRQMLNPEPTERISASQALSSSWAKRQEQELADLRGKRLSTMQHVGTKTAEGVLGNFRSFSTMNAFKKTALEVIVRHLDDSEFGDLREKFLKLDKERNGRITAEELRAGCKRAGVADDGIEALFDKMHPARPNAPIDYTQFLIAGLSSRHRLNEKACRDAFRTFDRDGIGKISKANLTEVLASDSRVHRRRRFSHKKAQHDVEMVESIFEEVDKDGDGFIDFDEFMAMLHSP
eukprot:gnl/TRDRNA2_/TRDRNA2_166824_c0_seq1.p1 gnl/TRDRNA2_/TRDRNA2_166824_c0~~gnl/TRDRNA2_/TRDRNA2_166824_c0_seq1.p1  ORF type:complete len:631 (-),score=115.19 gnl/TRDRNA2_/TRDRNA2_166824_c0_seq1:15-1907(-)